MPFRPNVVGMDDASTYQVRLAGGTCLSGDNFGVYGFPKPLEIGDLVIFEDAALYTMVKTTTFNGMPLPSIVKRDQNGRDTVIKTFSYQDFKGKLG
jgi:carboxynorspermidine decarboxylase